MPLFWGWATTGGTASAIPSNAQTYRTASSGLWQAMLNNQTSASTNNSFWVQDQDVWMDSRQYYALAQNRAGYYRERTAEEHRQQEQAREAARLYQEEHMRLSRLALDRSRELLLSHLTPEQRKTFEKNQWFVVEGGKTKVKYRINTNTYAGNIHVLAAGRVTHRLCVHCEDVPLHDHHLAQKLWLEHDEERILKIANRQAA